MLSSKDAAIVYETLLSSPGMNDNVKIDLRIPRKQVLLLSRIIEIGLSCKDENTEGNILTTTMDDGTAEAMQQVANDLLSKAGLTAMNEKLQALRAK